MRIYGKNWNYNVCDCRYCLYWKGLRRGCVYADGCCCDIPQTPPTPKRYVVVPQKTPTPLPVSECTDCPYGRDSPCIGCVYCVNKLTPKLLKEMGRWPG